MPHIAQIVEVRLTGAASQTLSYEAYTRTSEWITQWAPRKNFQTALAATRAEALQACRAQIRHKFVPSWLAPKGVKPEHFEFRVSDQEVIDGLFWSDSSASCATWLKAVEV